MILRKPYVLFIRFFKPIHVLMAILISYLIYNTNKVLTFFTNYIYSESNVVGESIRSILINKSFFVIPVILILFSLLFLGIMFKKKKNITFYIFTIFAFLIILIINIYNSNFLSLMEKNIISIKLVKLNHDLVFINMIIEVVSFILCVVRGLGINLKSFNFDSDISNFNISEADREEIEVSINIDFNDTKRKQNKRLRHLKYLYLENKFIINIVTMIVVILIGFVAICFTLFANNGNKEGKIYNMSEFNFKVNKTLLLGEDFNGNKITDDYLVVVEVSIQSILSGVSLYLEDFSLNVGNAKYKPTIKYSDKLLDIGTTYDKNILSNEYKNYLITFEIPKKYIASDLYIAYSDKGYVNEIKLKPNKYVSDKIKISKKVTETLNFTESLESINFKINNFEIKNKFLLEYKYCISKDDCLASKEYLKPSINENFDKSLLMLDVEFFNNSDLNISSFYELFSKFGSIYYKIEDKWYTQKSYFEEIKSKKLKQKNKVYIGINSKISVASSIKLVFNIRESVYEYILK